MCIFSRSVAYVGGTHIFARRVSPDRQTLVYQMELTLDKPVAMILPLPVALPSRESDVHFVSLKEYEFFFQDVAQLFYAPRPPGMESMRGGGMAAKSAPRLIVQEIGDFVASFVPTQADFRRLDPRFVLRPDVWKQLPMYSDYGFAVFQLKAPDKIRAEEGEGMGRGRGMRGGSAKVQVHPMAFSFATRYADRLYFPTVHIHDEQVHPTDDFDHTLYAQPSAAHHNARDEAQDRWQKAVRQPQETVRIVDAKGMIDDKGMVLQRRIAGKYKNADIWIPG